MGIKRICLFISCPPFVFCFFIFSVHLMLLLLLRLLFSLPVCLLGLSSLMMLLLSYCAGRTCFPLLVSGLCLLVIAMSSVEMCYQGVECQYHIQEMCILIPDIGSCDTPLNITSQLWQCGLQYCFSQVRRVMFAYSEYVFCQFVICAVCLRIGISMSHSLLSCLGLKYLLDATFRSLISLLVFVFRLIRSRAAYNNLESQRYD